MFTQRARDMFVIQSAAVRKSEKGTLPRRIAVGLHSRNATETIIRMEYSTRFLKTLTDLWQEVTSIHQALRELD